MCSTRVSWGGDSVECLLYFMAAVVCLMFVVVLHHNYLQTGHNIHMCTISLLFSL